MKFKIGDLVKWYSEYSDGLVSDAGYGIILGAKEFSLEGCDQNYTSYHIYKNKHRDSAFFEERNLVLFTEHK
jgi:hypothetical protein|tara:strand:+ start:137 stop:352 length:216 start_codon:yes stop_codon:yes gene_type:complete